MKRVAFIGLGKQNSKDHLHAALKNSDVHVVAVCDSDENAARKCAEELGLSKHYTSVEEMAESESLDAAIVAVPPLCLPRNRGHIGRAKYKYLQREAVCHDA